MIRRRRDVSWQDILLPEDFGYLQQHIEAEAWYPMASFERLGVAILTELQGVTLEGVRMWGRLSASQYGEDHPELVAPGDPMDTLMRLKVLRSTLFDFPAFDIPMLNDGQAHVVITYHMGPVAEEAACHQTMGFCEGILSLAGATAVRGDFRERSWEGNPRTCVALEWEPIGH
jgi:hypothetical protein